MKGIIVAVHGNRGIGVTTFAAAVAASVTRMAKKGPYNVILISGDRQVSGPTVWVPKENNTGDLGTLLSQPTIYMEDVFNSVSHLADHDLDTLALLGYKTGSKIYEYNMPEEENVRALLYSLKRYQEGDVSIGAVIVDCTDYTSDALAAVALRESDLVVSLFRSDLQGIAYYKANEDLFKRLDSEATEQLRFLVQRSTFDPYSNVAAELHVTQPPIPVVDEAHRKMVDGRLFTPYADQNYRARVETAANKMLKVSEYVL